MRLGVLEGARDLADDEERELLVEADRPALGEVAERDAVHVLHGEVVVALARSHVVSLHDVRVIEPRRGPRLRHEPIDEVVVEGELRVEDLERDDAVEVELARREDERHGAAPERRDDLVALDVVVRDLVLEGLADDP